MSKKCIKCGHALPDDASFCPHCTADGKTGDKNSKTMEAGNPDSSGNIDFHRNHRGGGINVPQTEGI